MVPYIIPLYNARTEKTNDPIIINRTTRHSIILPSLTNYRPGLLIEIIVHQIRSEAWYKD